MWSGGAMNIDRLEEGHDISAHGCALQQGHVTPPASSRCSNGYHELCACDEVSIELGAYLKCKMSTVIGLQMLIAAIMDVWQHRLASPHSYQVLVDGSPTQHATHNTALPHPQTLVNTFHCFAFLLITQSEISY